MWASTKASRVFCISASARAAISQSSAGNVEKSVCAITQPCFAPGLMLNDPDCSPS